MRRLTLLAVVPLLALMIGTGTATAAPAQQARAQVILASQVRDMCWGVDTNVQPQWQGSNPQREYNTQLNNPCNVGGLVTFVIGNCAAPPYQGYCEFEEVTLNAFQVWVYTGYCFGYSNDLDAVVRQTCGGGIYQGWAGTGGSPDYIWNLWLEYYYPHQCPIYGGYTQRVITADTNGSQLYLSCPQGAGGQSYLAKQSWYLGNPIM